MQRVRGFVRLTHMRTKDPASVINLIQTNKLGQYLHKGQQLLELSAIIEKVLPMEVKSHCQVMNIREGILVLQCSSAAWAMNLRFQEQELLKAIKQVPIYRYIRSIEYKIRPPQQSQG